MLRSRSLLVRAKCPLNSRNLIGFVRNKSTNVDLSSSKYSKIYETDLNDINRPLDSFQRRHLGPTPKNVETMLKTIGYDDLNHFIESTVPQNVLAKRPLDLEAPSKGYTEQEMLDHLKSVAKKNKYQVKNFIGKGYYNTILPPVIQRNILESPEWYTSYTPYQPEISQGRLESLLNFQTVVSELTGLPIANSSLLDEATAAAEAMLLSYNLAKKKKSVFLMDHNMHPQTKSVIYSRSRPFDIKIKEINVSDVNSLKKSLEENDQSLDDVFGGIVQYTATDGSIASHEVLKEFANILHEHKALFSVAADPLALTLLKPPAELGADIALGSTQRFGVPLGFGGPHAAYFAVIEKLSRKIPGRIVGVSKDRLGNQALRLALQTREQHIKREKATSNICTAQALSANVAANYCVYHGEKGLKDIAKRIYGFTSILAKEIKNSSKATVVNKNWFDTLTISLSSGSADEILQKALTEYNMNLFKVSESVISLSLDEATTLNDLKQLVELFTGKNSNVANVKELPVLPTSVTRSDDILQQRVFKLHHSETAMLRYLHRLQSRDLSLANSMIPLGSCTMKLNATVEMIPITWPEFANIHPFQPNQQTEGYKELINSFEKDLCSITGFDGVSLQPNSGAQGEYAGLRVIQAYLDSKGESQRNICLIPVSAHGTNPASSVMCGFKVVPVNCLKDGILDLIDLKEKAKKYSDNLAAVMITYPSTYGLYEEGVKDAIDAVHENGGQVYLDGSNMNAQVGLTSPGDLGADVCHLNCHKTFAIPHGGGGPAAAPICVKSHLIPFLPGHSVTKMFSITNGDKNAIESISSAPYGNALVTPISYSYIKMMGKEGLPFSSVIAMLNANYMMHRLKEHYDILFITKNLHKFKHCAHEFIIDLRAYKEKGVEAIDVAKRLQDYGFHAPTLAFPVPGTLMIEPTESENFEELNRFVDAMISIKKEIVAKIEDKPEGMLLKNAPHSLEDLITSKDWDARGYTREQAAYPLPFLKYNKFWPSVARLDDTYGDTHLLCSCPSVEELANDID